MTLYTYTVLRPRKEVPWMLRMLRFWSPLSVPIDLFLYSSLRTMSASPKRLLIETFVTWSPLLTVQLDDWRVQRDVCLKQQHGGVQTPVAMSPWRLCFVLWFLIFVDTPYDTCFMPSFWYLNFKLAPQQQRNSTKEMWRWELGWGRGGTFRLICVMSVQYTKYQYLHQNRRFYLFISTLNTFPALCNCYICSFVTLTL